MNKLIPLLFFILSLLSASGQAILRSALSTNSTTTAPAVGEIMQWNGAAWAPVNQTNVITAALTNANTLYVRKDGNDAAAVRGSFNKAWLTVTNAVAAAQAFDTVLVYPGVYDLNGTNFSGNDAPNTIGGVNINDKTISLIGIGMPTLRATNFTIMVALSNAPNTLISGLMFEGIRLSTNTSGLQTEAVSIQASHGVRVIGCIFTNIPNHGVVIQPTATESTNGLVSQCEFYKVGFTNGFPTLVGDGAAVVPGSHWRVENNLFDGVFRGVEPYGGGPAAPIRGLTVRGNKFKNIWNQGVCLSPGSANEISDLVISDNNFSFERAASINGLWQSMAIANTPDGGIARFRISDNYIVGAMSSDAAELGIYFVVQNLNILDGEISDNTFIGGGAARSIALYDSDSNNGTISRVVVKGNTCISNASGGVYLAGYSNAIIRNTFIDSCLSDATASAISVKNDGNVTRHNEVAFNNITRPGSFGITLQSVSNNFVINNFINGATQQPIQDNTALGNNFIQYNMTGTNLFSGTNINVTTFAGRVGIGTNAPVETLQVKGSVLTDDGSATRAAVQLGRTNLGWFGNGNEIGATIGGGQEYRFSGTVFDNFNDWMRLGSALDTAISRTAAGHVAIGASVGQTNGTLLASNGVFLGNVGIGTNGPVMLLDLAGASISALFKIQNANVAGYSAAAIFDSNNVQKAGFGFGNGGAGSVPLRNRGYFWTASGTDFVIDAGDAATTAPLFVSGTTGNVGIGTNAPQAFLHITPGLSGQNYLRIDDTNGTPRFQFGITPGASDYAALFMGNITPSANNYVLGQNGSTTLLNGGSLVFRTSNLDQWQLDGTKLYPVADNTEFLGDSTHRIARLDVGTAGITNAGPYVSTAGVEVGLNSVVQWTGRSRIGSGANGDIMFQNNAGTDIATVQWGGATAAFPGLKRSSGHLRVSDGTGNTTTATNGLFFSTGINTTATTTTNINQQAGCVRLAAGQQTYTITNSLATTVSVIVPSVSSDDTALKSVAVIRGAGFFQLKGNAAANADCDLCWFIASP